MTYPAGLWIKCWSATSKHLARAVAWSHSVPRAIARPGLLIALLFVVAPLCLLLSRSRLHAGGNTITVNTLEDPGSAAPACALRDAITAANTETAVNGCAAGTGNDTINFNVSGTITLSSTLPPIANTSPGSLTIDGSGQAITIDGADSYQVLSVNSGATLNLDNMTIAHGNAAWGGGIFNNGGNVNVADSTFSGNRAGGYGGGGVYSQGTLTVTNSTFLANIGDVRRRHRERRRRDDNEQQLLGQQSTRKRRRRRRRHPQSGNHNCHQQHLLWKYRRFWRRHLQ